MTLMTTFGGYAVSTKQVTGTVVEASNVFEITFACFTNDPTEIPTLQALMGPLSKNRLMNKKVKLLPSTTYKGTLVFNGTSYTNCAIQSLTPVEAYGSLAQAFNYSISFVKDTSI